MSSLSVILPTVIDTASVGALRSEILLHRNTDLMLDASSVQRIGGLGVQVLLSAVRLWAQEGRSLSIVNASDAFNDMLRLIGAATLPELVH